MGLTPTPNQKIGGTGPNFLPSTVLKISVTELYPDDGAET